MCLWHSTTHHRRKYSDMSAVLLLQANGLHLSAGNVVVVAITATLAAIGSASIPNSALVSMVTVLQVGVSETPV